MASIRNMVMFPSASAGHDIDTKVRVADLVAA